MLVAKVILNERKLENVTNKPPNWTDECVVPAAPGMIRSG